MLVPSWGYLRGFGGHLGGLAAISAVILGVLLATSEILGVTSGAILGGQNPEQPAKLDSKLAPINVL